MFGLRFDVPAGTPFNVTRLARQFGVTPHTLGEVPSGRSRFVLVRRRLCGGWLLRGFTADYAVELSEVRAILGIDAVRHLMARPEDDLVWPRLEALRAEHHALLDRIETDFHDLSRPDERFHATLTGVMRNRFVMEFQKVVSRIVHDHYQWDKTDERHHHTGTTKLARDMAVLIDTGCRLAGYPSDMTRCGWFGTPDPEFLHVASIVEQAVQAGLEAARPGALARDVDWAAREVIAAAGYGDRFLHRTGHGLGIDIHEPPYISATSETVLQPGNVFSIEPGIYLEGRFGVRLEDIVAIKQTGAEVLSALGRAVRI